MFTEAYYLNRIRHYWPIRSKGTGREAVKFYLKCLRRMRAHEARLIRG